jgi:mono/diheme cytochrome c family protein
MTMIRALSLALVTLTAPVAGAEQTAEAERGKIVFRTAGGCVNCHGWAADGKTGVNLRSPPGSNLRESAMELETLIEVITCGLPGTAMPYHDRGAYRDDRCYGMRMSEFDKASAPMRGKSLREEDIKSVAVYLQTRGIGLGEPTLAECVEFFDNPAATACRSLK